MERRLTSRCSAEPFSASYIRRSKILAAKSISTGWAPIPGNPALLYSQARLEQDGCDHAFRSADEQRGQRRRVFQCAGSVFATE
jgi:hypothetical protein